MAYVSVELDMLATAAGDLAEIQSALGSAGEAFVARGTSLAAAAGDETSAAIATLFSSYGRDFDRLVARATAFHDTFARALATGGLAYAETEAANATMAELGSSAPLAALIMGGSGMPTPSQAYIDAVLKYVAFPYTSSQGVYTPESLYPLTGFNTQTLKASVSQGLALLDTAIKAQITAGNDVTVVGYSQSSIIASLEMNSLAFAGNPYQGHLSFTLLGNPMNPNGGLLSRFAGLSLPSIGMDFYGATPASTPYPTNVVTLQYDGYADFPRYPINVLSDLNAMAGIMFIHGAYGGVDPFNLPAGAHLVSLPTSPADVATNYYMITYDGLPLLLPLRAVPIIGNPLADLLQPDLTYLVNWGYGDPHYGYSTGYADVPTGFGLFPSINPLTFAGDLVSGAGQGVAAFVNDITGGLSSPSASSVSPSLFALPAPTIPTTTSLVQGVQAAAGNGVPILTPMADLAAAAFISVPQYDVTLFADGMQQLLAGDPMGLVNAIGYPIAATTGLWTWLGFWSLSTFLSEL